MKTYLKALAVLLFVCSSFIAGAQKNKDSVEVWLKEKRFTFIANSLDPLRGTTRFLNGNYDLTIRNDSLISYLPYFGRSTSAPMTPDDNGIMFTTTSYDYIISPRKKNGWNILITVKDQPNLSKFTLLVFSDGTATLSTNSNFRDPISFRGYIRSIKN